MATENNCNLKHRSHYPSTNSNQLEAPERAWSPSLEMLLRRLRGTDIQQGDKFANILDMVGEFGTFQRRLVALTFIPNMLVAFFVFADILTFKAQKPYCNTSWILAVEPNLSEAQQLNLTLPREPNGNFQTCLMYLPVAWDLESIMQFGLNQTESCQDGWIYPEAKERSLVNEFDLVCGKDRNTEGVQTMFTAGLLIGSLIFGFLSDKLGRYPTILISLLGLTVFGFGAAFVNTFHQYLFFRFGVSQAMVCYAISSVCLVTEWLMGQHRAHAIILEHCFLSVGIIFLNGLAYSLSHWRLLFLLGGAPVFPLISYIWILPESPRWLLMKGKLEEAKKTLCYAACVNKNIIPLSLLDKLQLPGKKATKASVLDFYSNKHLRKVILVMGCVWFIVGYSYFTLSFKLKNLDVNIYLIKVIPGLMEVPARLCCIFLLEQFGRKWSLAVTLFLGSLMCLLVFILPSGLRSMRILMILLGKSSLEAAFSVFFIYTAELLPTVLRGTGLGLMSLAWGSGVISSLAVSHQKLLSLPIFLYCISAILSLSLCSLLPETQGQALPDILEYYYLQTRNMAADLFTEEVVSSEGPAEVMKDPVSSSRMLKADSDVPFSASWQDMSWHDREKETDPRND